MASDAKAFGNDSIQFMLQFRSETKSCTFQLDWTQIMQIGWRRVIIRTVISISKKLRESPLRGTWVLNVKRKFGKMSPTLSNVTQILGLCHMHGHHFPVIHSIELSASVAETVEIWSPSFRWFSHSRIGTDWREQSVYHYRNMEFPTRAK